MKKLKTNAELRQTARGALSGRYTEIIPYVLYYVVMTSLITGWTSILPYEDCCTVFTPKHPRTKPVLKFVEQAEQAMDMENLIDRAVKGTECLKINR